MWTSEGRPEARAVARAPRVRRARAREVRRAVARGPQPPAADPPPGVELTTLAARPELVEAIYAAALEAEADIPSADPFVAVSLEQWRTFAIDRPDLPYDGCVVALAGEEVVGWASMGLPAACPGVGVPQHDRRAAGVAWPWRGRCPEARHASRGPSRGLEELETENDEANAPMRAINRRLGYRPLPDRVLMRAPLPLPPA